MPTCFWTSKEQQAIRKVLTCPHWLLLPYDRYGMFHGLMSSAPEEPRHLDLLLSPCSFCSWIEEFGQSSSESVHRKRHETSTNQTNWWFSCTWCFASPVSWFYSAHMTCCELCRHVEADRKCKTSPKPPPKAREIDHDLEDWQRCEFWPTSFRDGRHFIKL